MLYTKMRDILKKIPNITNFLKDNNLPISYLGVRYFILGKQEKIGKKGMESIMNNTGYTLLEVPIKTEGDLQTVQELQKKFLQDFELYTQKFQNDKKTHRRVIRDEAEISETLTNFNTDDTIDLGISLEDLF